MVPASIHDFFLASASVAGALIGLLFVAISVAAERLAQPETGAQIHRVRASAALTAFSNALVVSLFALVPGHKIGPATLAVSVGGLVFVTAVLLSLIRTHHLRLHTMPDLVFVIGLAITFVIQLVQGADVIARPGDTGAVGTIAILIIVCFMIGIARAWDLIGGPSIGIIPEVMALVRSHHDQAGEPADDEPS